VELAIVSLKAILDRIDRPRSAHLIERFVAARRACLQVLLLRTNTCPVAIYTRLGGGSFARRLEPAPLLCCEAALIDDPVSSCA